jgi:hypothetical protein
MGEILNTFSPSSSKKDVLDSMGTLVIYITVAGGIQFIFSYFYYAFY